MPETKEAPQAKPAEEAAKGKPPEGDFFSASRMSKWMTEQGLIEAPPETPKPAPKAADEDCPGCPPGTKKPFHVFKVDGKDVPVYTQEELTKLAEKALAADSWEKDLKAREDKMAPLVEPLKKIAERIEKGEKVPGFEPETREEEEENPFGFEKEEILDPAASAKIKELEKELQDQRRVVSDYQAERAEKQLRQTIEALDTTYNKARERFPFRDLVDPDTKEDLTGRLFASFVASLDNQEKLQKNINPDYKRKDLPGLIEQAAATFNKIFGPGERKAEVRESEQPPFEDQKPRILKPLDSEARRAAPSERAAFKGIDDSIAKGLEDPDVEEAMKEIGRKLSLQSYGLKND